jgi:hypothetical protein
VWPEKTKMEIEIEVVEKPTSRASRHNRKGNPKPGQPTTLRIQGSLKEFFIADVGRLIVETDLVVGIYNIV